mgnify:CR=1 FL=1
MLYMAQLIDNQCYKKKVSFVSSEDEDKKVVINLSVACNHEIPKNILTSIEQHINTLFFANYISLEAHKQKEQLKKEHDKLMKQNEKLKAVHDKQTLKHIAEKESSELVEKKTKKKVAEEREYTMPNF